MKAIVQTAAALLALVLCSAPLSAQMASDLRQAIARQQSGLLASLIAAGADLQAPIEGGWTPLHLAAMEDFADGVRQLLAAGAPPQARSRGGDTPLHRAGPASQALLLAAGADPLARNALGRLPLHVAARPTPALLAAGVDARDHAGMSALHVAAFDGDAAKLAWLLGQGADPRLRSTAAFDVHPLPGWNATDPQHRFAPGQRALDLVRWQHETVKWSTGRYRPALDLLEQATPRQSWFSR